MKKAFTLIELMIVAIIIGVMATMAIPGFKKMKERTYDNEARTMLKQVIAAEKMYRLKDDANSYIACSGSGVNSCTSVLDISLDGAGQWSYAVALSPLTATALRSGGPNVRTWTQLETGQATCTGSCL